LRGTFKKDKKTTMIEEDEAADILGGVEKRVDDMERSCVMDCWHEMRNKSSGLLGWVSRPS
jgi:hypothetical protein